MAANPNLFAAFISAASTATTTTADADVCAGASNSEEVKAGVKEIGKSSSNTGARVSSAEEKENSISNSGEKRQSNASEGLKDENDESSSSSSPPPRSSIARLSTDAVKKVCAGQVISDLSSAVKELIENSLDAGCTSLTVKLGTKCGGADFLQVTDDGRYVKIAVLLLSSFTANIITCLFILLTFSLANSFCFLRSFVRSGIPLASRPLACVKHATSKLSSFSDLYSDDTSKCVTSFGFRGEALFSLCQVSSKLVIVTRTAEDDVAQQITYTAGGGGAEEAAAARNYVAVNCARKRGTTVTGEFLEHISLLIFPTTLLLLLLSHQFNLSNHFVAAIVVSSFHAYDIYPDISLTLSFFSLSVFVSPFFQCTISSRQCQCVAKI
jgi:hypothetical protein